MYLIDLFANYSIIEVAFAFPKSSFLKRDKGVKLTIASKSHDAYSMRLLPMQQGIVKLLGSFNFGGKLFLKYDHHYHFIIF